MPLISTDFESSLFFPSSRLESEVSSPPYDIDTDASLRWRTLESDGPMYSVGSVGHSTKTCTPCSFYCFSARGCKSGEDCRFCHQEHITSSRARLRNNKRKINSSLQRDNGADALTGMGDALTTVLREHLNSFKQEAESPKTHSCGSWVATTDDWEIGSGAGRQGSSVSSGSSHGDQADYASTTMTASGSDDGSSPTYAPQYDDEMLKLLILIRKDLRGRRSFVRDAEPW